MGECNKDTAEEILDLFYENGGNFIDTYVMITPSPFSLQAIRPHTDLLQRKLLPGRRK